ncbi:MAG: hypothetical protein ACXVIB_03660 [Halobacteriota archaeon]
MKYVKKNLALFLVAFLALSLVSTAAVASAGKTPTKTPKTLATPTIILPNANAPCKSGDLVYFQWTAVSHATSYNLVHKVYDPSGLTLLATKTIKVPATPHATVEVHAYSVNPCEPNMPAEWQIQAINEDQTGGWAQAVSGASPWAAFHFY